MQGTQMSSEVDTAGGLNWWFMLVGALAAVLLFCLLALNDAGDFGIFLFNFFIVPLVSLVLIVITAVRVYALPGRRRQSLAIMAMFVAFWAVSWIACLNYGVLHTTGRWIFSSRTYKARVLAQPPSVTGDFYHAEWDGYGMAGSETVVYLVSDPSDRLVHIDNKHIRTKPSGKPCEVWHVHRMEKGWYSVTFYTNLGWEDCEGGIGQ